MIKYFLLVAALGFLMVSCNPSPKVPVSTPATADSITKPALAHEMEMLKVSELSSEELKDDSVFTDGSKPASWHNAGITNVKGMKLFIKQLQQWIVTNDKDSLAGAVKYPLNKTIKTKADLIAGYDSIFTKDVKLSFATLNFSQLFRNAQGVMTSGGHVWFTQQGKQFKIIAINP